jgi:hypothetical protein
MTMRYHYSLVRMAKIQNLMTPMLTRVWSNRSSHPLQGMQTGNHHAGRHLGSCNLPNTFFLKTNIGLPYNPAIMFLGIHPKEFKTHVATKTCTQVFIVTLFLTAKIWKPPSVSE